MISKTAAMRFALVIALLLVGCGNGARDLLDTSWRLVEIDGQAPLAGAEVTLQFEPDAVSGSTGCNHYFGEYKAGSNELTFGLLAQTEMACMEPAGIMVQERNYLDALSRSEQYSLSESQLRILCEGGEELVFAEADD